MIDCYLNSNIPEKESLFEGSIVIMIDLLRAGTSICVALSNGAKEVIPVESVERAVQVYANLSKEVRFLSGERNSIKPNSFDSGNSPFEFTSERIKGKTIVMTTSNGTNLFHKCKNAHHKLIGSFVNIDVVVNFAVSLKNNHNIKDIHLLCAGNDSRFSYEDGICAGAYIDRFNNIYPDEVLSDSALGMMQLYHCNKNDLIAKIKERDHPKKLIALGFENDINFALDENCCPVIPLNFGNSIKIVNNNSN